VGDLRPAACPISGTTEARRVFAYTEPPQGEIGFKRRTGQAYYREIWQFEVSNHFVSCHGMDVATSYSGDYVDATYADKGGMARTFQRIIALPAEKSDNVGRMRQLKSIAEAHFQRAADIQVLDVGAGLGVFPYIVRQAGWTCTALDPDERAVSHIRENVGVKAVCGDFMTAEDLGRFDIITFNKVLEHVPDPIKMLRHSHKSLNRGGMVYVELPDGEMAAREGFEREEFFVEHLHVFSFASAAMLANRAGFAPILMERLREPSTKFTLRMYCLPFQAGCDKV
jgi:SAM-dependent methyltransferase